MQIQFKKDILPHLIAVIVFYLVTVIYFNPVIFDNKSLNQHDITQWEGASKELIDYRNKTGEEGLWSNSMFSGMPAYLINTEYSDKIIVYTKIIASLGLPHPIRNIFLAFVAFYILLLVFKVNPYLAIGGGLAFGLSSYIIIGLSAGHNARIGAIALMPLVIAGIHYTYSYKNKLGGLTLTALGLALHLRENHLQITYYLLLISLVYGLIQLIQFIKEKRQKEFAIKTVFLVLAATIGVGTFLGKFLTTLEYSKYSIRGKSELNELLDPSSSKEGLAKSYAFEFSNGIFEPLTLFIPNFYGGSSSNFLVSDQESATYQALAGSGDNQAAQQLVNYSSSYWGSQRLSAPYYAGAIIVFLFVLGFFTVDRRIVIWLTIVSALGIMLTWGSNFQAFNYFMFDYFPGYNKFRSVTFAILLPLFAMPLLGMIALQNLIALKIKKEAISKLLKPLIITGGFCLAAVILIGMFTLLKEGEGQLPRWFTKALEADRAGLLRADALRSLGFILAAVITIWLYLNEYIKFHIMTFLLSLFILIDLFSVDKRYLDKDNFKGNKNNNISLTDADKSILNDKDPGYRVFNLAGNPWAESTTSYFHNSLGGYHGAKLRRYQELIENCLENETNSLVSQLRQGNDNFANFTVLNMLNVKYLKYGNEADNIIINEKANGAGWFVSDVIKVTSADDELENTCSINSKNTVVIDENKFKTQFSKHSQGGSIKLIDKKPGLLNYEVSTQSNGLGVFSEIYYPKGWKAFSGETELPILRVNYVLRALELSPADTKITFKFEPKSYTIGNAVTASSSIILIILILGTILYTFKSRENK